LGYKNVEFRQGDIENMPIAGGVADVVVSNCVLNLVPDKKQAFAERSGSLKKVAISAFQIFVLVGSAARRTAQSAAMYVGCVAGAMQKDEYLSIIEKAGFKEVKIQKEKRIELPDEILRQYLSEEAMNDF